MVKTEASARPKRRAMSPEKCRTCKLLYLGGTQPWCMHHIMTANKAQWACAVFKSYKPKPAD